MAFLAFSKFISFAALLAILLLLISFDLGAAAQPDIKPEDIHRRREIHNHGEENNRYPKSTSNYRRCCHRFQLCHFIPVLQAEHSNHQIWVCAPDLYASPTNLKLTGNESVSVAVVEVESIAELFSSTICEVRATEGGQLDEE
ncbi:uncharacterized protein HKW66_Vig0105330 [Vigna angularis]|uniref:Uncharacterized protein n=1 Tax=Phaseolus angularis TaxID=3914 RepID=A0A8T0KIY9_PHAAN|nr:uncharacterized protein HKW66_Vig0105330 [Vigna angularis]